MFRTHVLPNRYTSVPRTVQLLWLHNGLPAFYRGAAIESCCVTAFCPNPLEVSNISGILTYLYVSVDMNVECHEPKLAKKCQHNVDMAGILPQMMRTVPQAMAFFSIYEKTLTALQFFGSKSAKS